MKDNENKVLSYIELNPTQSPRYTLLWLHGLGADGNDFVPIIKELNLPEKLSIRFVFPHAPVMPITLNNGYAMRAWYDIFSASLDSRVDENGIKKSMQLITDLIEQETLRGMTTEKILLGGFSQGAVMALATALHYTKPLAGVIALSGYLPMTHFSTPEVNAKLPIFIAHGLLDPMVPYILGQQAATALEQAGLPVTWRSYPIAHTVSLEEINDISSWIKNIWT